MKTVLILANSSLGLYKFRNEFVLRLLEKYEVFVSVPDDPINKQLEEEGCQVIPTSLNRRGINPIEDFKLLLFYKRIFNRIKPNLVLTYTIKPNIYGGFLCRREKISYISTITGLGSIFLHKGLLNHIVVNMYKVALKKAECIFFQNEKNRGIFESYHIRGQKECLVNGSGVNLKEFSFHEYPKRNTFIFLFVGRIMREKGINEFLEAAKVLHSDDVEFQILGELDEDYQTVLENYEKQGVIRYLGFQSDVRPYINEASVVVLPSYHEGMSNTLLEASAMGRPVLATDISGCREIFEDGVTGLSCSVADTKSLIIAMKKFIVMSWEEKAVMGRRARQKVENEFDRDTIIDVYIKEIEQIFQDREVNER